jgi:leucyl-tRNA synthetase
MLQMEGQTMSKSKGTRVGPDEVIPRYGADALRTYVLFLAPADQEADWKEGGIEGISRFLNRVWRAVVGRREHFDHDWRRARAQSHSPAAAALRRKVHQTVRRVTNDIERFHFNTAISALMEMLNVMTDCDDAALDAELAPAYSEACEHLALLLAPFAPHLAEELWSQLGKQESVHLASWPLWDESVAAEAQVTIVVQVNGKVRDRLSMAPGTPQDELQARALAAPKVQPYLSGRSVRHVVVVPDRLVSIVVG